jgi:hypothetical protein
VLHELPLDQRTLHGHFSSELEPVLTIDPGDSVQISVPNAGWYLESGEQFVSRDPSVDTGHPLAGRSRSAGRAPARPSSFASTRCGLARGA